MPDFSKANLLTALAAGRNPDYVELTANIDRPPRSVFNGTTYETSDGIPLTVKDGHAILTMLSVRPHGVGSEDQRGAIVTIDTLDLTGTYSVNFNSLGISTYDAGAAGDTTEAEVIEGWAEEISSDYSGSFTATARAIGPGQTTNNAIVVLPDAALPSWTVDTLTTTGTGVATITADLATMEVEVYLFNLETGWDKVPNLTADESPLEVLGEGFLQRFTTAGASRMHVYLSASTEPGDAVGGGSNTITQAGRIRIGPCQDEPLPAS